LLAGHSGSAAIAFSALLFPETPTTALKIKIGRILTTYQQVYQKLQRGRCKMDDSQQQGRQQQSDVTLLQKS